MSDTADWTRPPAPTADLARSARLAAGSGRPRSDRGGGRVVGTAALTLWNLLVDAYVRLGFDTVADEVFRALVLARVIEPTSKADTVRVLEEIGALPQRSRPCSGRWAAASSATTAGNSPPPASTTPQPVVRSGWSSTTSPCAMRHLLSEWR